MDPKLLPVPSPEAVGMAIHTINTAAAKVASLMEEDGHWDRDGKGPIDRLAGKAGEIVKMMSEDDLGKMEAFIIASMVLGEVWRQIESCRSGRGEGKPN
jgi:hypothetical protein